jgi:CubicO group peptidase (beta-lactamase class C family)
VTTHISGTVAPGFERVRTAFEENFAHHSEAGAAFCAVRHGEVVADLWGGEARPGVAWAADTVVPVFSTTKGATASVLAGLVAAGSLDVDRTVASYWGEFAANGKADITMRQVLTHTSGVVTFDGYEDVVEDPEWWLDLDAVASSFAGTAPSWEPGRRHGYHGASIGLIANEVVRRVTGRTIGRILADDIAGPHTLDFHIGTHVPNSRMARLLDPARPDDPVVAAYIDLFTPEHLQGRAHLIGRRGMYDLAGLMDDPRMRPAEHPAGGGVASARGVAGLYRLLLDGTLAAPEVLDQFVTEQVRGPDHVLLVETAYGLVFQRPTPYLRLGPSPDAFGHGGLGGSGGFADPTTGMAVGYVMNQIVFPRLQGETRSGRLVSALYESL